METNNNISDRRCKASISSLNRIKKVAKWLTIIIGSIRIGVVDGHQTDIQRCRMGSLNSNGIGNSNMVINDPIKRKDMATMMNSKGIGNSMKNKQYGAKSNDSAIRAMQEL